VKGFVVDAPPPPERDTGTISPQGASSYARHPGPRGRHFLWWCPLVQGGLAASGLPRWRNGASSVKLDAWNPWLPLRLQSSSLPWQDASAINRRAWTAWATGWS